MGKQSLKVLNPEKWVDLYSGMLFSYAYARLPDEETVKDLIQDTFLSALGRLDSFKGKSSEKTWLFSILKNKITDWYRQKYRKGESVSPDLNPFFEMQAEFRKWREESAPLEWETDEATEEKKLHAFLRYCLSRLPEKWRIVFLIKYSEEAKTEEICEECGITASNLWVILHRARLQMRACMEKKLKNG